MTLSDAIRAGFVLVAKVIDGYRMRRKTAQGWEYITATCPVLK